ncbi:MAG: hypothetical protein NZ703_07680 [Gemmataceae bacterium]|nr:hypothetical protein [Gemmataceae bacterium]MCS7270950.1 hypothetical protein [Gemmataceae bacterium]MDW8243628.1 hypothetical protein [Thermogemmata sp.]
MSILLLWLLLVVILLALFWGGGLVAQGWWYQDIARYFPLRAAGAALLVGSYLTLWTALDRRSPGKYDTLFEFTAEERVPFNEFDAIRWVTSVSSKLKTDEKGQPVEVAVPFRRKQGSRTEQFIAEKTGEPFRLNGVDRAGESFMTVALLIRLEPQGEPVRFNALLQEDSRGNKTYVSGPEGRRFVEAGGNRYILADQIGTVYVPTPGVVAAALFLNLAVFIVWFVALWAILQFQAGHAAGLTLALGFATLLLVMPLLFKPNRQPAAAGPPPAAARWVTPESSPSVQSTTWANSGGFVHAWSEGSTQGFV